MNLSMTDLGWSSHFAGQLADYPDDAQAYRISEVHRAHLIGLSEDGITHLTSPNLSTGDIAVGDWVVTDPELRVLGVLERKTLIQRRAAGHDARPQLIAANVDTLFIVSSCNADFNLARLERYLALANTAGSYPVVVLTKADLSDTPEDYRQQIVRLPMAPSVELINAKDTSESAALLGWVKPGQTAAIVGSSGVGKTTLANAMTEEQALTADIRTDDAKGRHTTTARFLRKMTNGGWLIDTPGMREIQLYDAQAGLDAVFDDLNTLAAECRFSDCGHDSEPGCAIKAAMERGEVDAERLERWRKLERENTYNNESIAQARSRDKSFGKMVKTTMKGAKRRKGR